MVNNMFGPVVFLLCFIYLRLVFCLRLETHAGGPSTWCSGRLVTQTSFYAKLACRQVTTQGTPEAELPLILSAWLSVVAPCKWLWGLSHGMQHTAWDALVGKEQQEFYLSSYFEGSPKYILSTVQGWAFVPKLSRLSYIVFSFSFFVAEIIYL